MALLFKVGTLTIRTVAKPLASRFEQAILNHPVARAKVISIAQAVHRLEVAISRGAEGRGNRVFVGDMTEEKAVALASRIVSEGFIYSTALSLVLWETMRKSKEDAAKALKEAAARQNIQALHERHLKTEDDLRKSQEETRKVLAQMDARLGAMEQQLNTRKGSWFG